MLQISLKWLLIVGAFLVLFTVFVLVNKDYYEKHGDEGNKDAQ
jgi:hypothetical protein